MVAIEYGQKAIVNLLLNMGADFDLTNKVNLWYFSAKIKSNKGWKDSSVDSSYKRIQ